MTDTLLVLCTVKDWEEARTLADALVDQRVAACVNLLGGVESIYRWKDQVERSTEVILLIKTIRSRLPDLEAAIRSLHSYEVPEIIAFEVSDGDRKYLDWIREAVQSPAESPS